jgi:hypothetical protein
VIREKWRKMADFSRMFRLIFATRGVVVVDEGKIREGEKIKDFHHRGTENTEQ